MSVQGEDECCSWTGAIFRNMSSTGSGRQQSCGVACPQWRGIPIKLSTHPSNQPDSGLGSRLAMDTRAFDVSDMPDVVPVLAAACALREGITRIEGGTTLKHKESDRVEDLARLLRANGVRVDTDKTSISIEGGAMAPNIADPADDHRLAFAALVLSVAGPLTLLNPWVVAKSYPEFFDDARQAGWSILPIPLKGA
ncbi:MAG: hypothetical protein R3E66_13065 [bacterium]